MNIANDKNRPYVFRRMGFILLLFCMILGVKAQNIDEILLHFSEDEMEVPMEIREQMVAKGGNTRGNYQNFRLEIYEKRARFIRMLTPAEVVYEICVWEMDTNGLLVALCETRCGTSCGSKIRFYRPDRNWEELPVGNYIPEFTLNDIFNEKKLAKNYYTPQNIIKDFHVKVQMQLPQNGHDMMVLFTCLDELEQSEYQRIFKYLDGTALDLVWDKKTFRFKKSPPYFLND